ncbi:hypothetical protein VOLCADRAFT_106426 [Volvox carteri f. nagariensis]|uniref:C-type lectin domain-containing protein n=1 Tax=Volvox carteri f. nagariensis TaxID=3068 RepID=D8U795_VOLCA|nr:uncharacterized protein VOLCADRAFT_106426 [Volvox carteri f. nagariensis]EFJ44384.1 hypothetical protein VOLCADRAFT_106426 [Volvox carteri f. nagariensis]|eukprot:XP_002954491.1 hypothetical protein VOLCADRAFT_106426 [Volvox carteri f. nagariensis]
MQHKIKGFLNHRPVTVALTVALFARVAIALEPHVTLTSDDGTQYLLYRTGAPITAAAASDKCASAGGTLASLASAEQVAATLWSQPVVDAAAEETVLMWTGLKLTWPNKAAAHRRMLRGTINSGSDGFLANLFTSSNSVVYEDGNEDDSEDEGVALVERLLSQMDATTDFLVPTHLPGGQRRLPELIRLWLFQQQHQEQQHQQEKSGTQIARHRHLLASPDGGSPFLEGAELTWDDGSDADFVLSNTANMGFLACNRKKMAACCGAVFDIGPHPYPGSDFPTIFFYPCGAEKVSGVTQPSGFMCRTGKAAVVAELPRPTTSSLPKAPYIPPPTVQAEHLQQRRHPVQEVPAGIHVYSGRVWVQVGGSGGSTLRTWKAVKTAPVSGPVLSHLPAARGDAPRHYVG